MDKITLTQAKLLKPYQQGDLDALCGLYSAINAIRLAIYEEKKLTKRQARELMEEGLDYLGRRKLRLLSVCSYGMGRKRRLKLVHHLMNYVYMEWDIHLEVTLFSVDHADELEAVLMDFIRKHLVSGNSVCIELRGAHKHYSVVTGISPKYIDLFDSDGLTKLSRQVVSVGKGNPPLRHTLLPSGCFSMSVSLSDK